MHERQIELYEHLHRRVKDCLKLSLDMGDWVEIDLRSWELVEDTLLALEEFELNTPLNSGDE